MIKKNLEKIDKEMIKNCKINTIQYRIRLVTQ